MPFCTNESTNTQINQIIQNTNKNNTEYEYKNNKYQNNSISANLVVRNMLHRVWHWRLEQTRSSKISFDKIMDKSKGYEKKKIKSEKEHRDMWSRMEMGEKQIEGKNAQLNGRILNHILFQAQNILVNLHKIDLHHWSDKQVDKPSWTLWTISSWRIEKHNQE